MAVKCDIKSIEGAISEVNSNNEQKVVAVASWNNREDTINIRSYNVVNKMLLKGIGLTNEEAENLVYILLGMSQIDIDIKKAKDILDRRKSSKDDIVDLDKMLDELDEEDANGDYIRDDNTGGIKIIPNK